MPEASCAGHVQLSSATELRSDLCPRLDPSDRDGAPRETGAHPGGRGARPRARSCRRARSWQRWASCACHSSARRSSAPTSVQITTTVTGSTRPSSGLRSWLAFAPCAPSCSDCARLERARTASTQPPPSSCGSSGGSGWGASRSEVPTPHGPPLTSRPTTPRRGRSKAHGLPAVGDTIGQRELTGIEVTTK